jgi:hypothetical protein
MPSEGDIMSFSVIVFFVACIAAYKLGSFNARRPGVAWACCQETTQWLWKWMSK